MRVGRQGRWSARARSCAAVLACGWLGLALAGASAQPAGPPAATCAALAPGPARTVVRVIDGETVALDDGSELRLVGALAPRAIDVGADPGAWPLEVEAAAELRALVLGKSIAVAFGGEPGDRYGRMLAHAFIASGAQRRWVQGHLLEQGLARAYLQAGNRACARELLEAEAGARRAGRGLWADAAYRIRAADPEELASYRNTFQVVEGRIARVAQARGIIYINFGPDRRAFAVRMRRSDRELLIGGPADDAKALEGAYVRIRGWVELRRQAPIIDLSMAGLLETIAGQGAAANPGSGPRRARERDPAAGVPDALPAAPETKPPGLVETGR